MRARLGCVASITALMALALASSVGAETIVCLGDSLTEGFGVSPERSYPSLLQQRLQDAGHEDVRVVNAGISGSTTASALSRLRWQLRSGPDILLLALGANDGLRGLDLEATEKNLSDAIVLAKAEGVAVVLAGMKLPPNYGADYTSRFEALFPSLARRYDVALIPFLLDGVAAKPDLNLADGIHPNAEGYERVVLNVLEVVLPLLSDGS
jgi:acyl-CoA thioesterase-1